MRARQAAINRNVTPTGQDSDDLKPALMELMRSTAALGPAQSRAVSLGSKLALAASDSADVRSRSPVRNAFHVEQVIDAARSLAKQQENARKALEAVEDFVDLRNCLAGIQEAIQV